MKTIVWAIFLVLGMVSIAAAGNGTNDHSDATNSAKLDVALFGDDNELQRPENLDTWVFLGTTLGMTYTDDVPDPASPGLNSSVFIAPEAYRSFMNTGAFPDGTVFVKVVRETEASDGGFSMGEVLGIEAHVKDKARFPKHGFNFYFFPGEAKTASAFPEDNVCVACHMENAAFDNVFTQFYPSIRGKLAE